MKRRCAFPPGRSWRPPSAVFTSLIVGSLLLVAHADVITEWNALLLDAIRLENNAPTLATRNLAILHTAMFDTVNAFDGAYQPIFLAVTAPAGASAGVAAVAAGHRVLVNLYPSGRARYDEALADFLAQSPATAGRDETIAFGRRVADAVLEWRASDGISTTVPYIPSTEPGHWRRTPPFFRPPDCPQCPLVAPFTMITGDQFRSAGPPPLASPRYAEDFNQVKELGALQSATRTAEQSMIARFWSDFSYTVTPPGHWNQIAAVITTARGTSLAENARLFALLNIALADAAIVSWDMKYAYDFWRPITAIRAADRDGNPATELDAGWQSFLNAPPFPEYTSGHSTFSKCAANVLTHFFGTDAITFTIGNDTLAGVTRTFDSLAAAADECGISRIYGGIHFLSANRDGKASGAALANYVHANFLLPIERLPKLNVLARGDGARLQLFGQPGRAYLIEASADLRTWVPVSTNVAVPGDLILHINDLAATAPQFYRAQALAGGR